MSGLSVAAACLPLVGTEALEVDRRPFFTLDTAGLLMEAATVRERLESSCPGGSLGAAGSSK